MQKGNLEMNATIPERACTMSAPMIAAYYSGLKGETRRIIKCPKGTKEIRWLDDGYMLPSGRYTGYVAEWDAPLLIPLKCPYGKPGDELWFRENWRASRGRDDKKPSEISCMSSIWFEAAQTWSDGDVEGLETGKLRTSRFMCRWMARARHIPILDVRAERLQDITEDGAINEGIKRTLMNDGRTVYSTNDPNVHTTDPIESYRSLWESIHGTGSWALNPWCWVIKFPLYKKP